MSGKEQTEAGKKGRSLAWGVFLLLIVSFVIHVIVGTRAYDQFGFSSDGFHYYSALRNSAHGYGEWEGPTYEHLLGNHAYLTLFSLAPLVKVFGSPLVLFYATVVSWHLSVLLVFLVADYLVRQSGQTPSHVPAALGLAYLGSPLVIQGASGFAGLFQPAAFVALGLTLLAYAYFRRERILFLLALVFVLWTHELSFPLVPLVLIGLVATSRRLSGADRFGSKVWVLTAAVGLVAVAVSFGTLFHYRSQNSSLPGAASLGLASLTDPGMYVHGLLLLLPALPFAFAFWRAARKSRPIDLRLPLAVSLGLSVAVNVGWMAIPVAKAWPVHADQVAEIRRHMPRAVRYEVILLPEFHLAPFADRSPVTYEWWHALPARQKDAVARQVNWAVMPKADSVRDDVRLLEETHVTVFETKDYRVMRRIGPQVGKKIEN